MNDYVRRGWFLHLILSVSLIASSVLAADIAADYIEAFGNNRASLYFILWEAGEILLLASVTSWFVYETTRKTLGAGVESFLVIGTLPLWSLLRPETFAGTSIVEWVTGTVCLILLISFAVRWKDTPMATSNDKEGDNSYSGTHRRRRRKT